MSSRGWEFDKAELVERLAAMSRAIVHGPAGFGKSHLLRKVKQQLGSGAVYLDASQFEHPVAMRDLLNSVDGSSPPGAAPVVLLDEPSLFVSEFSDPARPARGLETLPARVLLATRNPDALPIARLRLEGGMEFVGPDALRIIDDEVVRECARAVGRRAAVQIAHWSNGWPAAILLLTEWLANPRNPLDAEGSFIIRSGVGGYIDQEILAGLPQPWIRALTLAGLVDGCDRALLDAMSPQDDLGRHLIAIAAALDGLTAMESDRIILHPLLKAHLAHLFEALPRAERSAILARASSACDAAGRVPEGARLATRIGGGASVLDYLRRAEGLKIWLTGGFDVVRLLVEQAGPAALASEPWIKLLKCIVHVKEGRVGEAEALFAECLPELEGDPVGRRDAEVIRTMMLVYGCRAVTEKDFESFNRIVLHNNDDPAWKAYITTLRCILSTQAGNLQQATAYLADATNHSRSAGSDYNLVFLDIHRANIELARGEIAKARDLLKSARKGFRQKFPEDLGLETVLSAIGAYLEFAAGRLSSARAHLRKSAHRMPQAEAWFDVYAAAYEPYARLLAEEIGLQSTLAALESQKAQLRAQDLPGVAEFVGHIGDCLIGEAWLRGRSHAPVPQPVAEPEAYAAWQGREVVALANAYAALAADAPARARDLLRSLVDDARKRELHRSELRGLLLLTAVHDRLGEGAEADESLKRALGIADAKGTSRDFAEFGGESVGRRLRAMLKDEAERRAHPRLLRSLDRWFGDDAGLAPGARFTPREREILEALDEGGSDKVVGRRIGIGVHGVRYHLKNIYRKLRVHDRVDALAKARAGGDL